MSVTGNQSTIEASNPNSSSVKSKRSYRVLIGLLRGVPLSLGIKVRRSLYRNFFGQLGNFVHIETDVEFIRPYLMEIGEAVQIRASAYLEACGENCRLSIEKSSKIDRGVDIRVHNGGHIDIGERTYIGPYSCLSGRDIKIGKNCMIASHSSLYSSNHLFTDSNLDITQQGSSYEGIVIEDNCWLGTGVRVLDGVTIGQGSVIGAGAVVTKDIPSFSVAVGVPAKVLYQRNGISKNSEFMVSG